MAAQRAVELLQAAPACAGQVRATLRLGCGCVITRDMAADRMQETVDGKTLVVGKFPCPDHVQPS